MKINKEEQKIQHRGTTCYGINTTSRATAEIHTGLTIAAKRTTETRNKDSDYFQPYAFRRAIFTEQVSGENEPARKNNVNFKLFVAIQPRASQVKRLSCLGISCPNKLAVLLHRVLWKRDLDLKGKIRV
jgi:hypothetical protein